MDMDQAAVWLGGSILTALGFVVIVIAVVIVNNILHKYWKPVILIKWQDYYNTPRFASQEELDRLTAIQSENKKDTNKKS